MSSEQLSSAVQTAKHICLSSGVRFTQKRQKVLEVLVASTRPLSAYELLDQYRFTFNEEIQAMSIYRILEFLKEEQLVHKLNLNNKYIACSHILCCQEHGMSQFMICTECGQVEEASISTEVLESLKQRVLEMGYSMVSPHLELACVCNACASNASPSK